MAKYTLLGVVNSYLDATDGFRVSTLDDTIESQQVAKIAGDVFYECIADTFQNNLSKELKQLEALADSSKPNYLQLPDNVLNVHESTVYYNTTNGEVGNTTLDWDTIEFLHPQDFLEYVGSRSTLEDNTEIVTDFSGQQFVIRNKTKPRYCTTFDDEYLVFDAYDSDVDSTLQKSKSGILCTTEPTFTISDNFVIPLPLWYQSTYVNLVKARASEYLRQEALVSDSRMGMVGKIKARMKQRIGNTRYQKKHYGRR